MKTIIFVTSLVVLYLGNCQSQWPGSLNPLPQVQQYMQLFNSISTLHSNLSKTPLKPFLPPVSQMTADAMNAFRAASNFQAGLDKAMAQVNAAIADAAKQANLPAGFMNQFSNQAGNAFNQMISSSNPNA